MLWTRRKIPSLHQANESLLRSSEVCHLNYERAQLWCTQILIKYLVSLFSTVKDKCLKKRCHRGDCLITSTPPYFQCSCNHPYKMPNCQQGEYSADWIVVGSAWQRCFTMASQRWEITCSLMQRLVLSLLQLPFMGLLSDQLCLIYRVEVQSLVKSMMISIFQEFVRTQSQQAKWELFPVSIGHASGCIVFSRVTRLFLFSMLTASSPCKPNPCKNGGICIRHKTRSKFTCECPKPFRGRFCEIGMSPLWGRG